MTTRKPRTVQSRHAERNRVIARMLQERAYSSYQPNIAAALTVDVEMAQDAFRFGEIDPYQGRPFSHGKF